MNKLFSLKKWLTLPETSKHLSILLGEEVSDADVLQLALDGRITLSLNLVNGAYARDCQMVEIDKVEWDSVRSLDGYGDIKIPKHGRIFQEGNHFYQITKGITELESTVWDLPLIGGERIDVEYEYQRLTSGPEVTAVSLEGVFVRSASGELKELQTFYGRPDSSPQPNKKIIKKHHLHPDNFHPSGALPEDSVFVVRTGALVEFERSLANPEESIDKPLSTVERNTLLTIIAALCSEAKIDYKKPAKAAANILHQADLLGLKLGETTIENHLKRIPKALESRAK